MKVDCWLIVLRRHRRADGDRPQKRNRQKDKPQSTLWESQCFKKLVHGENKIPFSDRTRLVTDPDCNYLHCKHIFVDSAATRLSINFNVVKIRLDADYLGC